MNYRTSFSDPLEIGRNLPINKGGLKMRPQDLEDDYKFQKSLEGKATWENINNIPDFENQYENFENQVILFKKRKEKTEEVLPKPIVEQENIGDFLWTEIDITICMKSVNRGLRFSPWIKQNCDIFGNSKRTKHRRKKARFLKNKSAKRAKGYKKRQSDYRKLAQEFFRESIFFLN